jgi:hypothetical protein
MSAEEQIEEILLEANSYGLWKEVLDAAKKLMEENPKIDRVSAFEEAFNDWVK